MNPDWLLDAFAGLMLAVTAVSVARLVAARPWRRAAGVAGMGGMSGMPGDAGSAIMTLRYPGLALAFAFILAGYSIWDLDRASGRRYRMETSHVSLAGAPRVGVPGPAVLVGVESGPPGSVAPPDAGPPHGSDAAVGEWPGTVGAAADGAGSAEDGERPRAFPIGPGPGAVLACFRPP